MIPKTLATLLALALFVCTGTASAQVTRIPGTGCPGSPSPQVVGNPAIGQGFGVICPPPRTVAGLGFVILGGAMRPSPIDPLGCVAGCMRGCDPWDVVQGTVWRMVIPNDPRLVGVCFCVQCGSIERFFATRACIDLAPALQVCITR